MDQLLDDARAERWQAAVTACLHGHPAGCTYGGVGPWPGYWLAVEGCDRNHGERCDLCGADAVTGFAGWHAEGSCVWRVATCEPCGEWELARHPDWQPAPT